MTLAAYKASPFLDSAPYGNSMLTQLASAGFLLLFPGFLIYHYGISVGWWGATLGGLFGGGAALVALFACSTLLKRGGMRQPIGVLHLLVLGTLIYISAWSLVGYFGVRNSLLEVPIMVESIGTVVIWIAMLYIGAYLTSRPAALHRMSSVGIAIVLLCFGHAFYTISFPLGPFTAFFVGQQDLDHATYQGAGRSLLAIGLLASVATRPASIASLLILTVTALLLLSLGSRAHLYVICGSLLVHVLIHFAMGYSRFAALTVLFLIVIIFAIVAPLFIETRAGEVLDLEASMSWQTRAVAMSRALEVIAEHPLAGMFGYHFSDPAGYAHNALSAWTQFGFFGFFAFIVTSASALYISFRGVLRTRGRKPAWLLALHFNLVAIALAIATEPIMHSVFPALAWGLTMRAQRIDCSFFASIGMR